MANPIACSIKAASAGSRHAFGPLASSLFLTCAIFSIGAGTAMANPRDGVVAGGSATISQSGKTVTIDQHSDKAIIDWRSFDIDADEATRFNQPSTSSTALNRVNNGNPTRILGSLSANGNVILINPNGVMFGKTATVDVNGIVATTADIDNDDFMAGKMQFDKPGHPDAIIVNQGRITAADAGLVGLVAPNVANSGVISAKLGKVTLASGDRLALDLYGDDLISVDVSDNVRSQMIINSGTIDAAGGTIALTAAAGRHVVNSLIQVSGELSAPVAEQQKGRIVIAAEGANAVKGNVAGQKGVKSGASGVIVDGKLDASGRKSGEKGGAITITGDSIALLIDALIDASGDAGGGDIKIGGDYLGSGETSAATQLLVEAGATIRNDAVTNGNGGRTILWSDGATAFHGTISGKGGALGGNGGFVETSGKQTLTADGSVDLSAPMGQKGTYLLDPAKITIYGGVTPTYVSTDGAINLASSLVLWLDPTDRSKITLTYSNTLMQGATATGVMGGKTVTLSQNLSGILTPGMRMRLGAAGTASTAEVLGANSYTVASVSGTSVTFVESLTQSYTGSSAYLGMVSSWKDQSTLHNDARQTTASRMPVWVSGMNGAKDVIRFSNSMMTVADNASLDNTNGLSIVTAIKTLTESYGSAAILSKRANGTNEYAYALYYQNGNKPAADIIGADSRVRATDVASNGTLHLIEAVYDGAAGRTGLYIDGKLNKTGSANASLGDYQSDITIGSFNSNYNVYTNADYSDLLIYRSALSTNARSLVDQYLAVKWNTALAGSGTGANEVERATAANGYSAFTTQYLNRLSQSANVALVATDGIDLDLKGASLTLADDRSLSLTVTNGDIRTLSSGSIETKRIGNGGNILLSAGGSGSVILNHDFVLTAANGGSVTIQAAGAIVGNATFHINSGDITLSSAMHGNGTGSFTYTPSIAGTIGLGGSGSEAIQFSDASMTAIANGWDRLSFGSLNGAAITSYFTNWRGDTVLLTNDDIRFAGDASSAGHILARSASGDIILNGNLASTAGSDAIVLSAGRNFINHAGVDALQTPNGRWLVYSTALAQNIRDGLAPDADAIFDASWLSMQPGTVDAGSRFLFSSPAADAPLLTVTADTASMIYGDLAPALTYGIAGFVDMDTIADLLGAPTLSTAIDQWTGAGLYDDAITIAPGSLASHLGYRYQFENGDMRVDKADLLVTAEDASRYADEADPALSALYSGFKNGDTESVLTGLILQAQADASAPAGQYSISATGAYADNYNIHYVNGTLTVLARPVVTPPVVTPPVVTPPVVTPPSQPPSNAANVIDKTDSWHDKDLSGLKANRNGDAASTIAGQLSSVIHGHSARVADAPLVVIHHSQQSADLAVSQGGNGAIVIGSSTEAGLLTEPAISKGVHTAAAPIAPKNKPVQKPFWLAMTDGELQVIAGDLHILAKDLEKFADSTFKNRNDGTGRENGTTVLEGYAIAFVKGSMTLVDKRKAPNHAALLHQARLASDKDRALLPQAIDNALTGGMFEANITGHTTSFGALDDRQP